MEGVAIRSKQDVATECASFPGLTCSSIANYISKVLLENWLFFENSRNFRG